MLINILKKHKNSFFPILGKSLNSTNSILLDLSIRNPKLMTLDLTEEKQLEDYIFDLLKKANVEFGHGGYAEHRHLYGRSDNFDVKNDDESRCIHLGIDLWGKLGTPIYAPLNGVVHSFQYNAAYLDYGSTIILEHELDNVKFYSLYGHLSKKSLDGLSVGQSIPKGKLFAYFGDYNENGGWAPHLHFQLMTDMLGHKGDFIGVSSKSEMDYYLNICPNPYDLIFNV
jgi:murein DD-endopeptidase MepM/ murein hydrolase activator NlpD